MLVEFLTDRCDVKFWTWARQKDSASVGLGLLHRCTLQITCCFGAGMKCSDLAVAGDTFTHLVCGFMILLPREERAPSSIQVDPFIAAAAFEFL